MIGLLVAYPFTKAAHGVREQAQQPSDAQGRNTPEESGREEEPEQIRRHTDGHFLHGGTSLPGERARSERAVTEQPPVRA